MRNGPPDPAASDVAGSEWAIHGWGMNPAQVTAFVCGVTAVLLLCRLAGLS